MPETRSRIRFFACIVMLTAVASCTAKDKTASDSTAGSPTSNETPVATPANTASSCPSAAEVTKIMGIEVRMLAGGRQGDMFACEYSKKEGGVTTIAATIAPAAEAKEDLDRMASNGQLEPIPVGEKGQAYGSTEKSEAAAFSSGRFYHIEITNIGLRSSNYKDPAVALLRRMISGASG